MPTFEHKLPTSEQMRDAINGYVEPFHDMLEASHTWDDKKQEWDDDYPVTDEEKHAYCIRRTGFCATFISPSLYARAEREGIDMRRFVIQQPMPELKVGGKVLGHITKISIGRKVGKHRALGMPYGRKMIRRCRGCSGFCLLGLNGKCVACSEDDMT